MFLVRLLGVVFVAVAVSACTVDPLASAVEVEVTGCGLAFDGSVAGMVVEPDLVVTVAHGVVQGDVFTVVGHPASVVGLDLRSDLALLHVEGLDGSPLRLGEAGVGDDVTVVGGQSSPTAPATVVGAPTIRIEEVLGTRRVERAGLELESTLEEGDSGAGVVTDDGRLAGIVFAVNERRDGTAWAVASAEIRSLQDSTFSRWECDRARSRLVEVHP